MDPRGGLINPITSLSRFLARPPMPNVSILAYLQPGRWSHHTWVSDYVGVVLVSSVVTCTPLWHHRYHELSCQRDPQWLFLVHASMARSLATIDLCSRSTWLDWWSVQCLWRFDFIFPGSPECSITWSEDAVSSALNPTHIIFCLNLGRIPVGWFIEILHLCSKKVGPGRSSQSVFLLHADH